MNRLLSVALMVLVSLVALPPGSGGEERSVQGIPQQLQTINQKVNEILRAISAGVSTKRQRYYLAEPPDSGHFVGNEALTACAAGFHMANLFEFLTLSNLVYDSTRGITLDDSGSGPPAGLYGWVRTGGPASVEPPPPTGIGNCDVWTSNLGHHAGSTVALQNHWLLPRTASGEGEYVHFIAPWLDPLSASCNTPLPVWCIEH